jgi:hypothetical protein
MFSPHLPAPSSNLHSHHRWERIKFIFIITLLGLWAGGTGAFIVLGWLWPTTGEADTWAISYSHTRTIQSQLEDTIHEELRNQLVTVYSASSSWENHTTYLSSKDKLGNAMILSTDGWLGIYAPLVKPEGIKSWKIVTNSGNVLSIENFLKDPVTSMVYVKVSPPTSTIWHPVEFVTDAKINDEVFILTLGEFWKSAFIDQKRYSSFSEGHSDTILPVQFELSQTVPLGSIVVSKQGRVVGVGRGEYGVLLSTVIAEQLPSLLTQRSLFYPSLGIEGWFSEEQSLVLQNRITPGFLVTKTLVKDSLLHKGDIILKLNGEIVEPEKMWYTIRSSKEVNLQLLREEKIINIKAPISSKNNVP